MVTETEKREFLTRLGKLFLDPDAIDQAVFDREVAKIDSPSGARCASLRELDAYGVFNSNGSVNEEIVKKYGIKFDEDRIKSRIKSYGEFNHLSFRELIVFESAISSVINELSHETEKKTFLLLLIS